MVARAKSLAWTPWRIYDPITNTWSDGPSMGTAGCETTAILLSDGRVLVTGGLGAGRQVLSTAEIYTSE